VLPHECHELRRWPVDCQELRLNFEVLKHVLVKSFSAARSLSGLVDVKVEDAHWVHFVLENKILLDLKHIRTSS